MPWLFPVDFYAAYDIESLRKTTQSLITLKPIWWTRFPIIMCCLLRQRTLIDPLQAELGTYVDESIAKFVLGELDINAQADVDAFYAGLARPRRSGIRNHLAGDLRPAKNPVKL